MELVLLIACLVLLVVLIYLTVSKQRDNSSQQLLQDALRTQMQENREELNKTISLVRQELTQTLNQGLVQIQDSM